MIRLGAPTALEGARIDRLVVDEGNSVEASEILAELDNTERRRAAVIEAEAKVAIAAARLAQVKAGAKAGEIAAAAAMEARDAASLEAAEREFHRAESLREKQTITGSEYDKRRMEFETAQQALVHSRSKLAAVREVRDVDVQLAAAELQQAEAAVIKQQAELNTSFVRAPFSGRILRVHARSGEKVSDRGVVEMGDTSVMEAVAEVYEADIPRVQLGQTASIDVPSHGTELTGTVSQIGSLISRKDVLNNDPVADTDARVVEVRIRLDAAASLKVAGLTNMRIHVRIDTQPPSSTAEVNAANPSATETAPPK